MTVTVNPVNDPPTARDDSYSTSQGSDVSGNVLDNDSDVDDSNLSASLQNGPSNGDLNLNGNGSFTFDPDGDFRSVGAGESNTVSFDYTASDGNGGTDQATATITVNGTNDTPVANNDSYSTSQGSNVSGNVLNNDSDVDGDNLSASLQSSPSKGDLNFDSDGSFTFDPNGAFDSLGDNESENVVLKYVANDGNGGSDGATATITVNGRNDPPTASKIEITTKEDQSVSVDVRSHVGDAEDDAGALSVSVGGSGPSNGSISDADPSDLTLSYTPNSDFHGSDAFQYEVEDSGGETTTATAEITIEQVPDLTLVDGSSSQLGFDPEVTPGTSRNPVGLLEVRADNAGATIDNVTLTSSSPGIEGIEEVQLYRSSDRSLSQDDARVAETPANATGLSETVSIDFDSPVAVKPAARYFILSLNVRTDAPAKDVRFTIQQASDISLSGGTISTVESSGGGFPLKLSEEAATLPVELTRFDAQTTEDGISLRWRTASEQNNAAFQIQRKTVGASDGWETLGRRKGAGTTSRPQSYRFTDADLPYAADSLTYRLRQVDTDGETHLSAPASVARGGVEAAELKETYPNPARRQVTVRYAVPPPAEGKARISLYDVLGREVRTTAAAGGRQEQQFDVSTLSSGVYVLRLHTDTAVETRRLTVVR